MLSAILPTLLVALFELNSGQADTSLHFPYSTYLGGDATEIATRITVDDSGNAYITGRTVSGDFPTVKPFQNSNRGQSDAFVTKISPSGAILYSTYVGGSSNDAGNDIAVDRLGSVYVTGNTSSTDFPVTNPQQARYGGNGDAFFVKLDQHGNITYSRYLGGEGQEEANGLALDSANNVYIAGSTTHSPRETKDAYVVKLNSSGDLLYAAGIPGENDDVAQDLAVDPTGVVYVTGLTLSAGFQVMNPFQASFAGSGDCFLARIGTTGLLEYSTYFGGSARDFCSAVAIDSSGIYVAGGTESADFPIERPAQASYSGRRDGFAAKFDRAGRLLNYSTYLGGTADDSALDLVVDSAGYALITGYTYSTTFPQTNPVQTSNAGASDAFLARVSSSGSLIYSGYFGGTFDDVAYAIAIDSSRNVYMAGWTASMDFPVASPVKAIRQGDFDAFVTSIPADQLGPQNDDFTRALVVTGTSGTSRASNRGATLEPGEYVPGRAGRTSVWWRWTAPFSGTLTIGTAGSDFDTVLAVYAGSEIGNLALAGWNDDTGGNGTSLLTLSVDTNTTYHFAVSGFSTGAGNIVLRWSLRVPPLAGSSVELLGLPPILAPQQESTLGLNLGIRYPLDINGRVTMLFTPDAVFPADDPGTQFSNRARTIDFRVPANSSSAIFSDGNSAIAFQTGTVAGTITFRVTLTAIGEDITPSPEPRFTVVIPRGTPVITGLAITDESETLFQVAITGFAPSREITKVTFAFIVDSGFRLETASVELDVASLFSSWYQSAEAIPEGSRFMLRVPFAIDQGTRRALHSVTAALSNSVGASPGVMAEFAPY